MRVECTRVDFCLAYFAEGSDTYHYLANEGFCFASLGYETRPEGGLEWPCYLSGGFVHVESVETAFIFVVESWAGGEVADSWDYRGALG